MRGPETTVMRHESHSTSFQKQELYIVIYNRYMHSGKQSIQRKQPHFGNASATLPQRNSSNISTAGQNNDGTFLLYLPLISLIKYIL